MSTLGAPHQSVESPLPRGPYAISADAAAADQRRRLLEALPGAVSANGFDETTVADIVKLAQVRRNAFYEQFADKHECFAAAHEIAQERLLGVLTYRCYTQAGLADRVCAALGAGLELLGSSPSLTHLIVIEAPAAGEEISARYQQWLERYSHLLRLAAVGDSDVAPPRPALEPAIVGAIVSRVKQLVLAGQGRELPSLGPELAQLTLSYYDSPAARPGPLRVAGEGVESAQPQSPERSSVLELA